MNAHDKKSALLAAREAYTNPDDAARERYLRAVTPASAKHLYGPDLAVIHGAKEGDATSSNPKARARYAAAVKAGGEPALPVPEATPAPTAAKRKGALKRKG